MSDTVARSDWEQRNREIEERYRDEPWWPGISRVRHLFETSRVDEARTLVRQLAEEWPAAEFVRKWDELLAPGDLTVGKAKHTRSLVPDRDWLKEHAHEYPGQWLAVYEGRLIVADPSLDAVEAVLRANPDQGVDVTLYHVPARSG